MTSMSIFTKRTKIIATSLSIFKKYVENIATSTLIFMKYVKDNVTSMLESKKYYRNLMISMLISKNYIKKFNVAEKNYDSRHHKLRKQYEYNRIDKYKHIQDYQRAIWSIHIFPM